MLKDYRLQILFIAIATAIAGEVKMIPFGGEFRIGLGSSTFCLLLLFMHHLPYVRTGVITGITVVVFRSVADSFINHEVFLEHLNLATHFPAMFYYIAFAVGMSSIDPKKYQSNLLRLGAIVSLIDISSNTMEIIIRKLIHNSSLLHLTDWFSILVVTGVRTYFVVGLYSSLTQHQMRTIHREQKKRIEQMLNVGSSLYGESFYLKKSMDEIERITANSYDLYRNLKDNNLNEFSKQALRIAEQIHEVKKDSQRILSGLIKLYDQETAAHMKLSEVLNYVTEANHKYSELLGKKIVFEIELLTNYVTTHYLPLLTAVNNLVSNAVEAIGDEGRISIQVYQMSDQTFFIVQDTGKGILQQDIAVIYEAGFTTKYNEEGIAATGIGLSHVRNIVELFTGEISIRSSEEEGTKISMSFPTYKLKTGE